MKRTLMFILSLIVPWLVLLFNDDPVGALIALVMQATLIGWIPASMWAWKSVKKMEGNKKAKPTSESRDVR